MWCWSWGNNPMSGSQRRHDGGERFRCNGETESFHRHSPRRRTDPVSVNTGNGSVQQEEWATGVAGIDGSVSLNHRVPGLRAKCRNRSPRHCALPNQVEAQGISYREDLVPNGRTVKGYRHEWPGTCFNLNHSKIQAIIVGHHGSFGTMTVLDRDRYGVVTLDDMIVG